MNIADKSYVAIDYRLTLDSGEEVDSSPEGEPLEFITGAGEVIPGLETALMGMKAGDSSRIIVEPEDGYGTVSEELFQDVAREEFPADAELEPGMTFEAQGPHGPVLISVARINEADNTVTVDLNHPLAGKRLLFDVNIVEVREPSAEELAALTSGCGCGCGSTEKGSCGPGDSCGSGGCGCC
ncbi:MAG: peptidylprolyl isomerase [Deltaproteobacteria bacterium]|nr:peptidylprolyl isomerase [Deltaproteobacteria bacterium]